MDGAAQSLVLHASTVAFDGCALILTGASGSGKSSLAIDLLSRGCDLVADDRTVIVASDAGLVVHAPDPISGIIECRGIGLLRAPAAPRAWATAIVDLDVTETERLPPARTRHLCGVDLRLFHKVESAVFAAGLLQYLRHGDVAT